MIEQNLVSHLLDGMVKCRNCGTPMERAGESFNEAPRYVCTTKNKGCNTPEIEAEPFNRLVVRRAIHAFLNPANTLKVLAIILDEAMSEGNEDLRAMLDLKEITATPNEEPPPRGEEHTLTVKTIERWGVIYGGIITSKPLEEVESAANEATASRGIESAANEATASRGIEFIRGIDFIANEATASRGIEFIANEATASRKVEEYSLNPDTYLRPSNIQTTKTIMETLISEVLVDPDSATIRYSLPVNPGGWPESRTSEEVPTK
jgi:hypothetical protein